MNNEFRRLGTTLFANIAATRVELLREAKLDVVQTSLLTQMPDQEYVQAVSITDEIGAVVAICYRLGQYVVGDIYDLINRGVSVTEVSCAVVPDGTMSTVSVSEVVVAAFTVLRNQELAAVMAKHGLSHPTPQIKEVA